VEEPLKLLLGLGLDRVHNLKADPEALRPYGAEKGYFDVVFEASGSAKGLAAAVGAVRAGGAVVQIGLGGEIPAPMTAMVSKEVALLGSFRFHDEFAWAVRFIADGSIPVASLLTAVFPLSDAVEAFDLASDRRRAMKVQLSF
jgi:L-idonate 5-dehydrogenase